VLDRERERLPLTLDEWVKAASLTCHRALRKTIVTAEEKKGVGLGDRTLGKFVFILNRVFSTEEDLQSGVSACLYISLRS
jgi:hypothetical protein